MKRQRGVSGNGTVNNPMNPTKVEEVAAAATGKKKVKKEEGKQKVVEEERKESSREVGGLSQQGTTTRDGVVVMGLNREECMPWLGGGVDEQMSWGSTWFPGWDMDFMGESFSALYSDVVWDDDIWNHKKEIPIPLHGKRFDWE